ncbi:MAG: hypothetical protein ABEK59_07115 [Halobacteria archaeon]
MKPKHLEGVCDLGDCREIAIYGYMDDEADIYVEVCEEHAEELEEQFDSEYGRVEQRSNERNEPTHTEPHECGGALAVFEYDEMEHRFCRQCSYAMLIEYNEDGSMDVEHHG